ncbi:hypothetical protein [Streptomyces goshikiensis]|uniref:hypothetical protein n=1 Tax=Streptomyces goshikiensis TaxID=1942 RepID=UPI00364A234E
MTEHLHRIELNRRYAVQDLAALVGFATSTVGSWAAGGYLGSGANELHRSGGVAVHRRVWTGRELRDAAQRPRPVQSHDSVHPTSSWARGCRAGVGCSCRQEHNASTTADHRRKADAAFTSEQRAQLLELLANGAHLNEATTVVGVRLRQVWGLARRPDLDFADQLDAALTAGRDPQLRHGSSYTYARFRCRCPECREAKAANR